MLKFAMRNILATSMCVAAVTAVADEPQEKDKKETKVETRVLKVSKHVTVGPDGEIQIEEISGDSAKLPKKALEALKKAGIDVKGFSNSGPMSIRIMVGDEGEVGNGKTIQLRGGNGDIKLGGEMTGKIIIMDDNGERKVQEFGSKLPIDSDAIAKKIREAMKKQLKGKGETEEAIESAIKQVEKALSGIDSKIGVQVRGALDGIGQDRKIMILGDASESAVEVEDAIIVLEDSTAGAKKRVEKKTDSVESKVLSKLDTILKRLEKLEADVEALKENEVI